MSGNQVFYWQGLVADELLLERYETTINKLLSGQYQQADLDLKKLADYRIYSVRVNDTHRLLFTTIQREGKPCLLLLEEIRNHKYTKSRFLKRSVLKKYMDKHLDSLMNNETMQSISEKDFMDVNEPLIVPEKISKPPQFKAVDYHNQKFIIYNDSQKQAIKAKLPLIISGAAGTGKTCVALTMLERAFRQTQEQGSDGKFLFFSQREKLVRASQAQWEEASSLNKNLVSHRAVASSSADILEDSWPQIDFLSEHELLKKSIPELDPGRLVGAEQGVNWLDGYISKYRRLIELKRVDEISREFLAHPIKLYQEFRILCADPDNYLNLGVMQCAADQLSEKLWLIEAYKAYIIYLENTGLVDPAFVKIAGVANYDFVIIDEAQDLSYLQLLQLWQLAKNGAIVYCIGNHQYLFDSQSKRPFIQDFLKRQSHHLEHIELPFTYRCRANIAKAANAVLDLDNWVRGGVVDKLTGASLLVDDNLKRKPGEVRWINANSQKDINELKGFFEKSIDFVVITQEDLRKEAMTLFATAQVFTPKEVKGLEFKTVVVYKPFATIEAQETNKILQNEQKAISDFSSKTCRPKGGRGRTEYTIFFNTIITAFTRAKFSLIVFENDEHKTRHLTNYLKQKILFSKTDLAQQVVIASSEADRLQRAALLEKEGLIQQASALRRLTTEPSNIPQPSSTNAGNKASQSKPKPKPKQTKSKGARKVSSTNKPKQGNKVQHLSKPGISAEAKVEDELLRKLKKNFNSTNFRGLKKCTIERLGILLFDLPFKDERNLYYYCLNQDKGTDFLLDLGVQRLNNLQKKASAHIEAQMGEAEDPPLLDAVERGVCSLVKLLLELGAQVNKKNEHQVSALHMAARNGHINIVNLLLNKKADIEILDKYGESPLFSAIKGNHLAVIERLMAKGASIQLRDNDGDTVVHQATQYKHKKIIRLFLAGGVSVNSANNDGFTPLHFAAEKGPTSLVELLLVNGANLHAQSKKGLTALHVAIINEDFSDAEVFNLLLNKGADIKVCCDSGFSPLHHAAARGFLHFVSQLLDRGADINAQCKEGLTALHLAAKEGFIDLIKLLLQHGATTGLPCNRGFTPLHGAILARNSLTTQLLLDKEADIQAVDGKGRTPLHLAAEEGDSKIIRSLLDAGACTEQLDVYHYTPIHYAAYSGQIKAVKLLVNAGAQFNNPCVEGTTPLHRAAYEGHIDIVEFLLDEGAEINCDDENGCTPLHLAAEQGQSGVVSLLLEQDAEMRGSLSMGFTPLHFAALSGHYDTVDVLLDNRATLESPSYLGATPLFLAAQYNYFEIVKLLLDRGAHPDCNFRQNESQLIALANASNGPMKKHMHLFITAQKIREPDEELISISPYQIACIMGNSEIIELLAEATGIIEYTESILVLLENYNEKKKTKIKSSTAFFDSISSQYKSDVVEQLYFLYQCYGYLVEEEIPESVNKGKLGKIIDQMLVNNVKSSEPASDEFSFVL